jgi:hypothetical protein
MDIIYGFDLGDLLLVDDSLGNGKIHRKILNIDQNIV